MGLHPPSPVTALAFGQRGQILAAGTQDGRLAVLDPRTGRIRATRIFGSTVWKLRFHRYTLFAATNGGLVALKDPTVRGTAQVTFGLRGTMGLALQKVANGILVATGGKDRMIHLLLWTGQSFKPLRTLPGHTSWVTELAFLGDSRLASGGWDDTVRLWDTKTGTCFWTRFFFRFAVSGLLAGDGAVVASSDDGRLVFFGLHRGRPKRIRKVARFYGITRCCRRIWAITWPGRIFGLDLKTASPLLKRRVPLQRHESLRSLAAAPGRLAVGDSTGRIWIYRLANCP